MYCTVASVLDLGEGRGEGRRGGVMYTSIIDWSCVPLSSVITQTRFMATIE